MEASRKLKKHNHAAARPGCARALRVIGQVLADLHIDEFELDKDGDEFTVYAQARALRKAPARIKLGALLQRLQDKYLGVRAGVPRAPRASAALQLHYTAADIERLDCEHQIRSLTDGRKPDPYSLPELLRLVGSYVDRRGRLVRLAKGQEQLTLRYLTDRGEMKIEDHTIASFYDLSVHMYLKRSNRRLA
jgi:hypothetical protein